MLPEALALADLPDPDALADALRELADERYRDDGLTLLASKTGPMSEPLTAALRRAVSQTVWASASRQLGLHPGAHRRPDDLDQRLRPRHVPQLFWAEDYQREIADLFDFDDFTHWLGRRFCSVLLARMLTPLDWQRRRALPRLPRAVHQRRLQHHLRQARARTAASTSSPPASSGSPTSTPNDGLIDYKQRRARLADWDGIDVDCWHLLQPRPRPLSPFWRTDTPVRRAAPRCGCGASSPAATSAPRRSRCRTRRGLADQTHFIRDSPADPARAAADPRQSSCSRPQPTPARRCTTASPPHAARTVDTWRENYYLGHDRPADHQPRSRARRRAHRRRHPEPDNPSVGSHAPPAVTHARLLAARLLRRTARGSFTAIGASIGGDGNHLADNDRRYRRTLAHDARLAAEVDQLLEAVERWRVPAPEPPSTPHHQRMHAIAIAIKAECAELLTPSHGEYSARCTSISLCRDHTDLTCYEIADDPHRQRRPAQRSRTPPSSATAAPSPTSTQRLPTARSTTRGDYNDKPATPTRTSSAA